MSNYPIISSDSHIIEPEDLWEKHIDKEFRERGPRLLHEGENDQWICDGLRFGAIGINQQAGVRFEDPEKLTTGGSMETVPLGGVDPHAHVKDMDLDGVEAGVLYPSQALTLYRVPASDVLSASLRAYNDYLAEFCSPYPNRLKAIAMLNLDDVADGTRELERASSLGMAGAMISVSPMVPYDHPSYERFWATAQDLDMPLSLHVGTIRWKPGHDLTGFALQAATDFPNREYDPRQCVYNMIFSGVFERYPKLKVGVVEFEVAWAPTSCNAWTSSTSSGPWASTASASKATCCPATSSAATSSSDSRKTTWGSSCAITSVSIAFYGGLTTPMPRAPSPSLAKS